MLFPHTGGAFYLWLLFLLSLRHCFEAAGYDGLGCSFSFCLLCLGCVASLAPVGLSYSSCLGISGHRVSRVPTWPPLACTFRHLRFFLCVCLFVCFFCFLLESSYCCAFKFITPFLCSLSSVTNPTQCLSSQACGFSSLKVPLGHSFISSLILLDFLNIGNTVIKAFKVFL